MFLLRLPTFTVPFLFLYLRRKKTPQVVKVNEKWIKDKTDLEHMHGLQFIFALIHYLRSRSTVH